MLSSDDSPHPLKRPHSSTNVTDEPVMKYSHLPNQQQLLMTANSSLSNMPPLPLQMSALRGLYTPAAIAEYYNVLHKMHQDQLLNSQNLREEVSVSLGNTSTVSSSTTTTTARRQTMSNGSRPIIRSNLPAQIPQLSTYPVAPFNMINPHHLVAPLPDIPVSSPSPARSNTTSSATASQSSQSFVPYFAPCYQKADEEIYMNYMKSVQSLAAELQAKSATESKLQNMNNKSP